MLTALLCVGSCLAGFLQETDDPGARLERHFSPPPEFAGDLGDFRPVLRFEGGSEARTPEDWKRRRTEILRYWHEQLGPWPALLERPRITYLSEEKVENFTRRKAEVEVAAGRKAPAYLLIPDGEGPFPAVLDVFYQPEDGAGLNPERRLQNDFGYQLARRGFVALCIGQQPGLQESPIYYPTWEAAQVQPLSYLAYVSANCATLLANLPEVDPRRIGIVGHSYGGKWTLFAAAFCEKFAAVAVSDPGIAFDESRKDVNYWEPWYLGYEAGRKPRDRGIPDAANPRTGPYARLVAEGRNLHEILALIAPRPLFVAGGSEDGPSRWRALNHVTAVNRLLGHEGRVGMSNRPDHKISPEANEDIGLFFERFLKQSANDNATRKR